MGSTLIWLNFSYFTFIREVHGQRKAVTGDLRTVVKAMVEYGIPFEEIEMAIEEFEVKRHNYASFGVLRRSLIFTQYDKTYDVKMNDVA